MKKYGLLGEGISYSLSPKIHRLIFEKLKIEGTYDLIDLPQSLITKAYFEKLMRDYEGINVTIPYKEKILSYVDDTTPLVDQIGAVNTVSHFANKLCGDNTDYHGIKVSFDRLNLRAHQAVFILGTGGASKAVLNYLKNCGHREIYIVSRNPNAIGGENVKSISYENLNKMEITGGLLVNCTPIGTITKKGSLPLEREFLAKQKSIFDMVYNPSVTNLMKVGRQNGLNTLGGITMLAAQAIKSEKIWHPHINFDENALLDEILKQLQ